MSVRSIRESVGLIAFGFGAAIFFAIAFVESASGFIVEGDDAVTVDNQVMVYGIAIFFFLVISNLAMLGYLKSAPQYAYGLLALAIATNLFVLLSGLDEVLGIIQIEKTILWILASSRGEINLRITNWYSENTMAKINGIIAALSLLLESVIVIKRVVNNEPRVAQRS